MLIMLKSMFKVKDGKTLIFGVAMAATALNHTMLACFSEQAKRGAAYESQDCIFVYMLIDLCDC